MGSHRCDRFRGLIARCASGKREGLSLAEHAELKAHLVSCPDCQERFSAARIGTDSGGTLKSPGSQSSTAAETPTEREATVQVSSDGPRSRRVTFPRLFWLSIAAVVIFILLGVYSGLMGKPRSGTAGAAAIGAIRPLPPTTRGAAPQSGLPSSWSEMSERLLKWDREFTAAGSPADALKLLQARFNEARERSDDTYCTADLMHIINLCDSLAEKWPDSWEALESAKLVSLCYTELGEAERSREAFLDYAYARGEWEQRRLLAGGVDKKSANQWADEVASNDICLEGCRLFREKDYVAAEFYFDALLQKYPRTEIADRAQYWLGRQHGAVGQPEAAVAAYRKVIGASKDEALLRDAYRELSTEEFNRGRKDEAVKAMEEMAERLPNSEDRAYALYKAGLLQYARGQAYYVDALARLKEVVEKYPGAKCAGGAKMLISRIQRKMLDSSGLKEL